MNIYIVVDMEGISGVYGEKMVRVGSKEWSERTRTLATADVNAVIDGALEGGASRIWVQDGHDAGENLIAEELREPAQLIVGAQSVAEHMPGLDESFDLLFLIGFHARMGTMNALMDHSVTTTTVSEIRFNDRPVGEIGIYAAYAGIRGIPVGMVSGDAAATREAEELIGPIKTVSVMESYGRASTRVFPPSVVHSNLREKAAEATRTDGVLFRPEFPLSVSIDFQRSADADMAEMVPGAQRVAARTVSFTHEDNTIVFKALKAMVYLGGIAANRWAYTIYTTGFRTG